MIPPLTPSERAELDGLLAGQHPQTAARLAVHWYQTRNEKNRKDRR